MEIPSGVSVIQPNDGSVIEVYKRCRKFHFLIGYCRAFIHVDDRVLFLGAFRRCYNPGMTKCWPESMDIESVPIEEVSIECAQALSWMDAFLQPRPGPKER